MPLQTGKTTDNASLRRSFYEGFYRIATLVTLQKRGKIRYPAFPAIYFRQKGTASFDLKNHHAVATVPTSWGIHQYSCLQWAIVQGNVPREKGKRHGDGKDWLTFLLPLYIASADETKIVDSNNRMVEGLNANGGITFQPTGIYIVYHGQQVNQAPPVSYHDDEVATTLNQTDQEMVAFLEEAAAHVSHTVEDFSFTGIHMDENQQVQQAAQVRR